MLTNEQKFVLVVLCTVLKADSGRLNDWENASLDTDEIVNITKKNGILLTVYPALAAFPNIQLALYDQYYAALANAIKQDYEGKRIMDALSNAGFDCIGLKGWEIRKLYPEMVMRQMADLDILVRDYDFRKIKKVMGEIGYGLAEPESSWMHDSFANGSVIVELHKRLTDDSGEIQKWEKTMWSYTVPSDESDRILKMRTEDQFIFHIVHMHKDFLNGALGLRRIADTWLFIHKFPEMDWRYVEGQLDKMGLGLFTKRMVELSKTVMGETEMDDNSETLVAFAFQYGINGSLKSYKLGRIATMSDSLKLGRIRALTAAVFMPYARMKAHFPVLEKYPFLLPTCWLVRIFQKLKRDPTQNRRLLDYRGLSRADYEEMKRFFEAGGC